MDYEFIDKDPLLNSGGNNLGGGGVNTIAWFVLIGVLTFGAAMVLSQNFRSKVLSRVQKLTGRLRRKSVLPAEEEI